jgi:hypothetical protein
MILTRDSYVVPTILQEQLTFRSEIGQGHIPSNRIFYHLPKLEWSFRRLAEERTHLSGLLHLIIRDAPDPPRPKRESSSGVSMCMTPSL